MYYYVMPRRRTPPGTPAIERIRQWSHVEGDCVIWEGRLAQGRQPVISIEQRPVSVLRLIWEDSHGQIAKGRKVKRTCSNVACVAIAHMYVRGYETSWFCGGCDRRLPIDAFDVRKDRGVRWSRCRECRAQFAADWASENAARRTDQYRARRAADVEGHLRRGRIAAARWRQEHPEEARASLAASRQRHPETSASRSVLQNATREDLAYAFVVRRDPCCYCGCQGGTVDHIVARAQGGTDHWTNLTGACISCNSSKKTRGLLLWLSVRGEVV
jgi:5-methylcytosine-specific restriction endonuclease McrA